MSSAEVVVTAAQSLGFPVGLGDAVSVSYNSGAKAFVLVRQGGDAAPELRLLDAGSDFGLTAPLALGRAEAGYGERAAELRTAGVGAQTLLLSYDVLAFRHDFHGHLLLQTALEPGPRNPDDLVAIEILISEAMKLKDYLSAIRESLQLTGLGILHQLEDFPNWNSLGKWDTVVVKGVLDCLLAFFKAQMGEAASSNAGMVSLLASLMEKVTLYQSSPYATSARAHEDAESSGPAKDVMISEAARRLTFASWPHMHYKWALPAQMAEAGFFHQANQTGDDRVNCFACTVCLVCWEPADEPWSEHERHSPHCPFVCGLTTPNVPLALTLASLPAVAHGLHAAPSQLLIGNVANAHWLPIITPHHGLAQLWHLNALPKKPVEFHISLSDPFIGMKTGYMQGPRKSNRVTWSDDPSGGEEWASPEAETVKEDNVSSVIITEDATDGKDGFGAFDEGKPTSVLKTPQPFGVPMGSSSDGDMRIGAAAVVGRREEGGESCSAQNCSPALVLGLELDEARLFPARNSQLSAAFQALESQRESSTEAQMVEALNNANNPASPAIKIRRSSDTTPARHSRPFILVYKIDESASEDMDLDVSKEAKRAGPSDVGGTGEGPMGSGPGSLHQLMMADAIEDAMDEEMDCGDQSTLSGEDDILAIAPPPGELAWKAAGGGAKAWDMSSDKSGGEGIRVWYEAPAAGLVVLQCFRLPPGLDEVDWEFSALLPSTDGRAISAVLLRRQVEPQAAVAAVITYTLSFSGLMTGLAEDSHSLHFFFPLTEPLGSDGDELFFTEPTLLSAEAVGLLREPGQKGDVLAAVCDSRLILIDLYDGRVLHHESKGESPIRAFTKGSGDRMCMVRADGSVRVVQIYAGPQREEEEDVVDGFDGLNDASASVLSFAKDEDSPNNPDGAVPMGLEEAWELCGQSVGSGRSGTPLTDVMTITVPNSWSELLHNQRLRKNPQHYLREERVARWWQLNMDVDTWRRQSVELTLSRAVSAAHLDLRFSLHPACLGVPDVVISVFRRDFFNRSSTEEEESPGELIFGPVHLSEAMDVSGGGGLVQIAHPVLQSSVWRRLRVELRALDQDSGLQKLWRLVKDDFASGRRSSSAAAPKRHATRATAPVLKVKSSSELASGPFPLSHFFTAPVASSSGAAAGPLYPPYTQSAGTSRSEVDGAGSFPKPPSVDRLGLDWIQEMSISLTKLPPVSPSGPTNTRSKRISVLRNTPLHSALIQALGGEDAEEWTEESVKLQMQAFDIASWLFAHWNSPNAWKHTVQFGQDLGDALTRIIHRCFVMGTRTSAHRCAAFIADFTRLIKHVGGGGDSEPGGGSDAFYDFVTRLVSAVSTALANSSEARSSGALTWLFSLASQLIRSQPAQAQPLLAAARALLGAVGPELRARSTPLLRALGSRYGLHGDPVELEQWEWVPGPLRLFTRPSNAAPPPNTSASFGSTAQTAATTATAFFLGHTGADELDWPDLLNWDLSAGEGDSSGVPVPATPNTTASMAAAMDAANSNASYWASFQASGLGNGVSSGIPMPEFASYASGAIPTAKSAKADAVGGRSGGGKVVLGREQAWGLLETEPLGFSVVLASEGVSVENVETSSWSAVPGSSGGGPGPIPLPDVVSQGDGGGGGGFSNSVSMVKAQVQTILSKQMQLLALQHQKQKLQGKLDEVGKGLGTQNSSASTFGVPTTPKTTPFMTPTPLSPSHLSPINSDTNLVGLGELEEAEAGKSLNRAPLNLLPFDLLKKPPHQALIIEKMNSGARKFVTLDFGRSVLLTDLVVPSCGDLSTLTVDIWLQGESVDGQRLVVSNDIGEKTLAISDLQPPAHCRYLKMTYIGRQGLGNSSSVRIPVGSFFGQRFPQPHQTALWGGDGTSAPLAHLHRLLQDIGARHRLATQTLAALVADDAPAAAVREAYRTAKDHKLHWNLVRNLLRRLEPYGEAPPTGRGWGGVGSEQLRMSAELGLALLLRSGPYAQLLVASPGPAETLTLPEALRHFRHFCVGGTPRLSAVCGAWLLAQGGGSEWWGRFLAQLLPDLARTRPDGCDREFLLLCYLTAQAVKAGNVQVVIDLLEKLLELLDAGDSCQEGPEVVGGLLLLLSVCFDIAALGSSSRKSRVDRWGFLGGSWGSGGAGDSERESSLRRKLFRSSIKPKLKWEDSVTQGFSLMEHQYQKTLDLAEDIKAFVGGKSVGGKTIKVAKKPIASSGVSVAGSSSKRSKSTSSYQHSSSKSKSNSKSSSSGHHKSWSMKIRLPVQLSSAVARALVELLGARRAALLPASARLLAFKVLSRVCASASPAQLGLARVASAGELEDLLVAAGGWERQALLSWLLELLEAEARAGRKEAERTALEPRGASLPPSASDSALLPSSTPQSSGHHTPTAALTPETPAGALALIDGFLSALKPEELPNCKVDEKTRLKYLRLAAREIIDINLNSGQAFEQIKYWIMETSMHEKQLASGANSASSYKSRMLKYLEVQKNTQSAAGFLGGWFPSGGVFSGDGASGSADAFLHTYALMGAPGDASSLPASSIALALPPGSHFVSMPANIHLPASMSSAFAYQQSPEMVFSVPSSAATTTTSAQLKEVEKAQAEQVAKAKEKLAKICEKMAKVSGAEAEALDESMETHGGGEDASGSGAESGGSAAEAESELTELHPAAARHRQLGPANHLKLLCLHMETQRTVHIHQPISLVMDERLDSRLGWAGEAEARSWLLRDEATLRAALAHFAPLSKPPAPTTTMPPTPGPSLEDVPAITSLQLLSRVVSKLISEFNSGLWAQDGIENIVGLAWSIANGATDSRSSGAEGKARAAASLELSAAAVRSLVRFLGSGRLLSQGGWVSALRLLTLVANSRVDDASTSVLAAELIVHQPLFPDLLKRIVFDVSEGLGGPVMVATLSGFLNRLRIFCDVREGGSGLRLRVSVLSVLVEMAKNKSVATRGSLGIPVDVGNVCVEFLSGQDFSGVPVTILAEAVRSFAQLGEAWLLGSAAIREPQLGGPGGTGGLNPRFAFVLSPDSSPNLQLKTFADRPESVLSALLALAVAIISPGGADAVRQVAPPLQPPSPESPDFRPHTPPFKTDDLASTSSESGGSVAAKDLGVEVMNELMADGQFLSSLLSSLGASFVVLSKTVETEEFPGMSGQALGAKPRSVLTLADWTTQLLGSSVAVWMRAPSAKFATQGVELLVALLRKGSLGGLPMSDSVVVFLRGLLEQPTFARVFLHCGGGDLIAAQLGDARGAAALVSKAEARTMRRVGRISRQVMGPGKWRGAGEGAESSGAGSKVEGMCNFSPSSVISSSSPMAHHLQALIAASPANRRARTPAWTYHFYPAELWLDLTLSLPHPILLREIHLKPHIPALQTGPSAVQVELSGDWNPGSLRLLGPPVATTAASKIRISTDHFPGLVQMVKIHLKRPTDSANMGMVQILLLGHSPQGGLADGAQPTPLLAPHFPHWLSLLRLLLRTAAADDDERRRFRRDSPGRLLPSLLQTFLSAPLPTASYEQLSGVMAELDNESGDGDGADVVRLLIDHLEAGKAIRAEALPWLMDLVFTVTGDTSQANAQRWWSLAKTVVGLCSKEGDAWTQGRLLWLLACVVWRAVDKSGKCATFFAPLAEMRSMCERLCEMGLRGASSEACAEEGESPWTSAAFLINALIRLAPSEELVSDCVGWLGLSQLICEEAEAEEEFASAEEEYESASSRWSVGRLGSSELALLGRVLDSHRGGAWLVRSEAALPLAFRAHSLISIPKPSMEEERELLDISELLCRLSALPVVQAWFATPVATVFATNIFNAVCSGGLSGRGLVLGRVERTVIQLFQNLLSAHQLHQELYSQMLGAYVEAVADAGLPAALQSAILFTLLEEETRDLLLTDTSADMLGDAPRTNEELIHPKYGCSRHSAILRTSTLSTVSDLLSAQRPAAATAETQPKAAPSFPSASTAFKAFASALSSSAPAQAQLSQSPLADKGGSWEEVRFLGCDAVSAAPLPGSMSVGQLVLAVADPEACLRLRLSSAPARHLEPEDLSLSLRPSPKSTLDVFAASAGLAVLAHHLHLYHPHSLPAPTRLSDKAAVGSGQGDLLDPYFDPFEFIDANSDSVLPSAAYSTVVANPSGSMDADGAAVQMLASQSALSPHVTLAFALFLRLQGYAELLVAQDRRKAQRLLRLAMGLSQGRVGSGASDGGSWLFLLPFSVLSTLYAQSSWATPEGREVRERSVAMGIPELLLMCLSAFSQQEPRRSPEALPEPLGLLQQLLGTRDSHKEVAASASRGTDTAASRAQYWAKGTGFGTGSTAQQWNIDLHNIRRLQDEQNITCILRVLADLIYPLGWSDSEKRGSRPSEGEPEPLSEDAVPASLVDLIRDSALIPVILSYLRNDSVLDMGRHVQVYESVLSLLCSAALAPGIGALLVSGEDGGISVWRMLEKLRDCMLVYVSKLKTPTLSAWGGDGGAEEDDDEGLETATTEEGLLRLVPTAERAAALLSRLAGTLSVREAPNTSLDPDDGVDADLSLHSRYSRLLKPLQFDSTRFFEEGSGQGKLAVAFHYESSIRGSRSEMGGGKRTRRLAQESVTLSTSLPLSFSSSVFVRTAEERLDLMKVLITGPVDTPYSNGCFEFDVFFPNDYPNSPMSINLQTTGGGTVRFNPNLYNDGKVCLSVLNTWHGRPEERWNPQTSSFLQVLVSIQSLILVSEPYFNEPGYERSRTTAAGQQASREYDANLRQATVRWGMLEMLRSPPGPFKDVIRRHFWLKRDEILAQVAGWLEEMEADAKGAAGSGGGGAEASSLAFAAASNLLVSSSKHSSRNIAVHLAQLHRHFAQLKEELAKMECPEGLEETEKSL